jgi:selenocysteine-specific elongation factor
LVRVHLGANQATAQVLMGQRTVDPGQEAFAVLRCEEPIVADYGQPFVIRQPSPARTIGGGRIVLPALRAADRQNRCLAAATGLSSPDAQIRLATYLDLRCETSFDDASESWIGLSQSQCEAVLKDLVERGEIVRIPAPQPLYVSSRRFRQLKEHLIRCINVELERRKPASLVLLSVVLSAMNHRASPPVLAALLDDMIEQGEIVRREDRVGLPTGPELSHRQRSMLTTLMAEVTGAGPAPPTLKEFAENHGYSLRDLEPLVQVAVDEKSLIRVSPQLVMVRDALEGLRQRLAEHFDKFPSAKVGEMRQQWGITRKHAVPIFEFFDQCQITSRAGDDRTAGPRVSLPIGEEVT